MILIGVEQIGKTAKEKCDDPNCNRTTCNTFYLEDRAFQARDLQVTRAYLCIDGLNFIIWHVQYFLLIFDVILWY